MDKSPWVFGGFLFIASTMETVIESIVSLSSAKRLAKAESFLQRFADGEVATRHKFLFFRGDPAPGPGSEVTVPLKDTSNPTNYAALFGAIAQILASTVAIVLVATKF